MIFTTTMAQDIEMGPLRVDTGDDWMDFGFAIALFVVLIVGMIAYHKFTSSKDDGN